MVASSSQQKQRWKTKTKMNWTFLLLLFQFTVFSVLTVCNLYHLSNHVSDSNVSSPYSPRMGVRIRKQLEQTLCHESDERNTTTTFTADGRAAAVDATALFTTPRTITTGSTNSFLPNPKDSFGSCLIIMDDNHFLVEWLAYHYHRLPLRRLIVAIDPRSQTSPIPILQRYANLMKITVWYEDDYMPPHLLAKHLEMKDPTSDKLTEQDIEQLEDLYLERQFSFYARCQSILKKEGMTWTAITDTDEYILPNPYAKKGIGNRLSDDEIGYKTSNQTIFNIIQNHRRENVMSKHGCITMGRIQFAPIESTSEQIQNKTPEFLNASDFSTLRWRYHDYENGPLNGKLTKCMVNLTLAKYTDFVLEEVTSHRPIKRLCKEELLRMTIEESPFVIYHYVGTYEQFSYRNDFRLKRSKDNFVKLKELNKYVDDTIRPWLNDFVHTHGNEMSTYLLDGAGRLTPKPSSRPK